jgi:hypothetical protein
MVVAVVSVLAAPWQEEAACLGLAPTFDAEAWTADACYVVRVCWACPVAVACELDAAAAGASGVRAGRVWRDGVPVDVLEPLPRAGVARCGTPSGYERHRRHGETPCTPCTQARSTSDAARRGRAGVGRRGRRPAAVAAEDQRLVAELTAVGWPTRRIAAELGVHESTVTRIRARLRAQDGEAA